MGKHDQGLGIKSPKRYDKLCYHKKTEKSKMGTGGDFKLSLSVERKVFLLQTPENRWKSFDFWLDVC